MVLANAHAIQEARKIQTRLAATQKCPDELAGWKRSSVVGPLRTMAGTKEASYPMAFDCLDDLSFEITIKYGLDSGTWVSGKAAGPIEISYEDRTGIRTIEISWADDATDLATKVVREHRTH
jgi:hypothetical protein